ncbi:hypothetical protein Q3G72_011493 [Acer saccharum]|nr:hypothetical protein Q3G72_011493 [Acer saccharum]
MDAPDAAALAPMHSPQQTISTSTWQAWLEQQVAAPTSAAANDGHAEQASSDNLQSEEGWQHETRPMPVQASALPVAELNAMQSALLRGYSAPSDSSNTQASASSVSTGDPAEAMASGVQQNALMLSAAFAPDSGAAVPSVPGPESEPQGSAEHMQDMARATFAELPTEDLVALMRRASEELSGEQNVTQAEPTQTPRDAAPTGDAPGASDADAAQSAPASAAEPDAAAWNLDEQARLAQAMPARTSASASRVTSFAERLSNLAPQAWQGDALTVDARVHNVDVEEPSSQGAQSLDADGQPTAPAQQTTTPALRANAFAQGAYALHGQADAPQLSAPADADGRIREQDIGQPGEVAVDAKAEAEASDARRSAGKELAAASGNERAADAERGIAAAELSAAPPTPLNPSTSAAPAADAAKPTPQQSQGLEVYASRSGQAALPPDTADTKAPAPQSGAAPADALGKSAAKNKQGPDFAAELTERTQAQPATSSPPPELLGAATRAQSIEGVAPAEGAAVSSPGAAEATQAAAMTTTVTPARLSAQLAANLSDGARRIQLRVAPPGLGTLDIGVHLQGAQVNLTIRGDQPELTRFMQEGMGDLQKNLQQHGLDLGSTDFRGEQQEGGEAQRQQAPTGPRAGLKTANTQASAQTPGARQASAHVIHVLL